jgi:hypothetical protein
VREIGTTSLKDPLHLPTVPITARFAPCQGLLTMFVKLPCLVVVSVVYESEKLSHRGNLARVVPNLIELS